MKQPDDWCQSVSFGRSIQIRVQDSSVTRFDKNEDFNNTQKKDNSRRGNDSDLKAIGRRTRSAMSDMVFADNKHGTAYWFLEMTITELSRVGK